MHFGLRGIELLYFALFLYIATGFCKAYNSSSSGSKATKSSTSENKNNEKTANAVSLTPYARQLKRMFIAMPQKHSRVLFTAPHSIALLRDGKRMHKLEGYVLEISRGMAKAVDAGVITWKKKEQKWIQNFRNGKSNPRPRKSNRDPNYLKATELSTNPWYVKKRDILKAMKADGGTKLTMHVDIHGQANVGTRKINKAELEIGLSAMAQINNTRTEAFNETLLENLEAVLHKHFISKHGNNKLITAYGAFGGHGGQRWTQARQSQDVGYDLSVQIEMSRDLRKAIAKSSEFQIDLANAFVSVRDSKAVNSVAE